MAAIRAACHFDSAAAACCHHHTSSSARRSSNRHASNSQRLSLFPSAASSGSARRAASPALRKHSTQTTNASYNRDPRRDGSQRETSSSNSSNPFGSSPIFENNFNYFNDWSNFSDFSNLKPEKNIVADISRLLRGSLSLAAVTWLSFALDGRVWGWVEGSVQFLSSFLFFSLLLDGTFTVAAWLLYAIALRSSSAAPCPSCGSMFRYKREDIVGLILACPNCLAPLRYENGAFVAEPIRPMGFPGFGFGFEREMPKSTKDIPKGNVIDVEATVVDKD